MLISSNFALCSPKTPNPKTFASKNTTRAYISRCWTLGIFFLQTSCVEMKLFRKSCSRFVVSNQLLVHHEQQELAGWIRKHNCCSKKSLKRHFDIAKSVFSSAFMIIFAILLQDLNKIENIRVSFRWFVLTATTCCDNPNRHSGPSQ